MRCPLQYDNAELLLAYCSRKLDQETQAFMERHMAQCPACREMTESQKAVWEALDAWDATPVSDDFDRRLYDKIEAEEERRNWLRKLAPGGAFRLRPAMGLAAACATVFAAFLIMGPASKEPVDAVGEELPAIEQVDRTLEDLDMLRELGPVAKVETGNQTRAL